MTQAEYAIPRNKWVQQRKGTAKWVGPHFCDVRKKFISSVLYAHQIHNIKKNSIYKFFKHITA